MKEEVYGRLDRVFTVSKLVDALEKIKETHGDLRVYYASDYDWGLAVKFASVEEDGGWDDVPVVGKYVALN